MQMVTASHPGCLVVWSCARDRGACHCTLALDRLLLSCALRSPSVTPELSGQAVLECVAEVRAASRDVNRVNEEWFSDMDGVRRKVGLMEEQPAASTSGKVRILSAVHAAEAASAAPFLRSCSPVFALGFLAAPM